YMRHVSAERFPYATRFRSWTGDPFLRVYTADRGADNGLSNAVIAVEDLNNVPFHIGRVAASADGTVLYVTRTYPGKAGNVTREEDRKSTRLNSSHVKSSYA